MLADLPPEPMIVEVGCAHACPRDADAQGMSTLAFVQHAIERRGKVHSIDIRSEHLDLCSELLTNQFSSVWQETCRLHLGRAEQVISSLSLPRIDLLYVDGDIGGDAAAVQVSAALGGLRSGYGRVVFDDCPSDDVPEHWELPEVRVSTVWRDPAAHGLRLEWRDGVCASFRAVSA